MGIFDKVVNNSFSEAPDIKGYNTACFEQVNAEAVIEEMAMFEAQISADFVEHQAIMEGVESFNEGVISDLWTKAKNFFKKIWAKLKAVFNNIMMRFNAMFMKKNKTFVKKYEKDLRKKLLANLDGLKVSVPEHCSPEDPISEDRYTKIMRSDLAYETDPYNASTDYRKVNEDYDAADKFEKYVKNALDIDASKGEVSKEMREEVLGETTTLDEEKDIKEMARGGMQFLLEGADKMMEMLKKTKNGVDKCFTKVLSEVEKAEKSCSDMAGTSSDFGNMKSSFSANTNMGSKKLEYGSKKLDNNNGGGGMDDKDTNGKPNNEANKKLENYRAWLSFATKDINVARDVFTEITSARVSVFQEQCTAVRKVLVKVYTFNPKKEDSFNEDAADSMMTYINFTEDYDEQIIL